MTKVIKGFFVSHRAHRGTIPLLRRHGRGYSSTTPAASQRKILFKSTRKVIPVAVVKKKYPGDSNPW
jgi:hypothetical protein